MLLETETKNIEINKLKTNVHVIYYVIYTIHIKRSCLVFSLVNHCQVGTKSVAVCILLF